jgi:hypothetical protein
LTIQNRSFSVVSAAEGVRNGWLTTQPDEALFHVGQDGATYQGPFDSKGYLTSTVGNLFQRDFKLSVTVDVFNGQGVQGVVIGLGDPTPQLDWFGDPTRAMTLTMLPRNNVNGQMVIHLFDGDERVTRSGEKAQQPEMLRKLGYPGSGTYHVQMEKVDDTIQINVRQATSEAGTDFEAKAAIPLSEIEPALATGANHLFVGVGHDRAKIRDFTFSADR